MSLSSRRDFLKMMAAGTAAVSLGGCSQRVQPNFVFFLVDDLGWKDLGCYGSSFYETPNIDKLASQGVRFTQAYAASPVCSPTRASILSGKHPARVNITDWIPGDDPQNRPLIGTEDLHQLPLSEVTLAESLKEAGYNTGFFGKWHLGDKGFYPEDQGFDVNVGGHWAGQPASYFYPYKNEKKRWDVPGLPDGGKDEYLTDRLTDETVDFIKNSANSPFLAYLAYYSVHTPIEGKPQLVQKYKNKLKDNPTSDGPEYLPEGESKSKQKQDNPVYASMVQSVDDSVGKILEVLESEKILENTIIIFMSDNGGLSTTRWKTPTSTLPLRAGKGWLYEGGIREPMIIKWPGKTKSGSVCHEPVISMDFYPTMLTMANLPQKKEQHCDGVDLTELLKSQKSLQRKVLFWHYPHYHSSGHKPAGAVRKGRYKLIERFEDGWLELYDLKEDVSEKNNLVIKKSAKARELYKLLKEWRREVGAKMPVKNNTD